MADLEGTRTTTDVQKVLFNARIDVKDLKNVTQTLYYGESFVDNDLVIMEVDNDLLNLAMKNGSLVFRGKEDDEVTLCTDSKTYSVKEAETSNSLHLLPDLSTNGNFISIDEREEGLVIIPQKVIGTFHTYLELTPIRPGLHRLYSILEENLYEGREVESEKSAMRFTFEDLLSVIQVSENELKAGLKTIEAYEIDGFWRMLEFDYLSRVVLLILNFIQENSWDLDKIKKLDILTVLQELEPLQILNQCLTYFLEETTPGSNDEGFFKLKEDKICRLHADLILRQAGRFDLKEFLDAWRLSVPEGFKTDVKQLEGMVLIERERHPQVISRLTIWDLPESVEERFKSLFKIRQKWRCDDIKPFIMDLTYENHTVDSLLTKHSRISSMNNERYCNAKY